MNKRYGILTGTVLLAIIAVLSNCDKKVGKVPVTTAPTVEQCDTIKFKHIRPIIETNCALTGCHSKFSANGDFTNYAAPGNFYPILEEKVKSGVFKLRLFDSPTNPMPPSGKLPQDQLNIIKCWLDKGHVIEFTD